MLPKPDTFLIITKITRISNDFPNYQGPASLFIIIFLLNFFHMEF